MAALAKLVYEDPHISIRKVSAMHSFSFGTVQRFLHKELHLQKLAANLIPHKLTDEQKHQRVVVAHDQLSRFEPDEPERVTDVIKGNETYVPFCGIASKRMKKKKKKS